MSQFYSQNNIGSANIVWTGSTELVEAAAARAVAVTKQTAANVQAVAEETGRQAVDAGTKVAEQTEAAATKSAASWKSLITVIGGVVGGFYAVARAASFLVSLLESGEAKAARFMEALQSDKAEKQIDKIGQRMGEIENILAGGGSPLTNMTDIIGQQTGQLQSEYVALQIAMRSAERQRITETTKDEKAKSDDMAKEAKKLADTEYESMMEAGAKITYDQEKKLASIRAMREKASDDATKQELDRAEKAVKARLMFELSEYEKAEAQKRLAESQAEQQRIDSAAKVAKAQADAIRQALSSVIIDIQKQSANLFNPQQMTLQLNEIKGVLETIASNSRNIGG